MTAKQLTDSILQMAIEGKLVPQDPNDEPASVLLEHIREEKHRLVKEGKLKKKDIEEIPVQEYELPFKIPEKWVWVRLNYVSKIARGGSPRPIKEFITDSSDGINWIKISDSDIGGKYIYKTKEKIIPEGVSRSRFVHKDDFLLTNSMSFGRPYILKTEGCIHDGWLVISFEKDSYDQDFMYYLLSSVYAKKSFSDKAAGAVVKNLNIDKVAESIFPLPPLAEQRRIVQRIEEIIPFVKEYGEAYEEASKMDAELPDKLKKSILQEAIMGKLGTQDPNDEPASVLLEQIREEKKKLVKEGLLKKKDLIEIPVGEDEVPFNIPDNWKWVRVSDMANVIMGQSPDGNDVYESLVIEDSFEFHQGKICFTEKYIAPSGKWCKKATRIAEADSLLVCVRAPIGDVNITQRNIGIGRGLSCLKGFCCISTDFLYYWMKAHKRNLVDQGTGSTFKAITVEVLKNQPIPLPPLAEQHRIVQKIEELYAEIDNMTINNTNINEVKETESKE